MTVVVAGATHWAWTHWQDQKLSARASETKTWNVSPLPLKVPVVIILETRCVNAQLNYQIVLEPWLEPGLPAAGPKGSGREPIDLTTVLEGTAKAKSNFVQEMARTITEYNVYFMDEEGFRVFGFKVPRSEVSRDIDEGGKYTSLSADGNVESCAPASYLRAISATISWKKAP